jgi:Ca2+-binding RTX toxin-like protein
MISMRQNETMRARSLGVLAMIALLVLPGAPARPAGGQRCGGRLPTIVGTVGDDRIRGTKRADVIVGLTGRDIIKGRGGRDRICGNRGRDDLRGGERRDRLEGNRGNDTLTGGPGRNRLKGGLGKRDYCVVNDDRHSGCELVEVPGD